MVDFPSRESVFGTRAIPRSRRSAQGYDAGVPEQAAIRAADRMAAGADLQAEAAIRAGQQTSRAADRYAKMAADIDALQEKRNEESKKLARARAQSLYLQKTTELESEIYQDPDYKSHAKKWEEGNKKITAEALSFVAPEDRELLSYALQDSYNAGLAKIKKGAFDKETEAGRANVLISVDGLKRTAAAKLAAGDKAGAAAAIKAIGDEYDGAIASLYFPQDVGAAQKMAALENSTSEIIDSLPARNRGGLLFGRRGVKGQAAIKKEDIIKNTIKIEGGYNPDDGASDAPVIYGINESAHPKQFKEAMRITQQSGEQAGKDYALKFFANEYYDKYDLGQFTPEVQQVLFDGMINHWPGFRKKLIAEAVNGAGPEELIEFRRAEYQRLATQTKDPEKLAEYKASFKGWMNRLDEVSTMIQADEMPVEGIASLLPPEVLARKRAQYRADIKIEARQAYEADIVSQLNNQDLLRDMISDPSIPTNEKIVKLNAADLNGAITDEFGEEARRYLNSVEKLNASTDSNRIAPIIQRMYDLNSIADTSESDYLTGVQNIRQDIMAARSDGKLTSDDEEKLNAELKKLTSSKISEASSMIAYSFGEANKLFERQLPPERRNEAVRALFDMTQGRQDLTEADYTISAQKIIDDYNKRGREKAIAALGAIKSVPTFSTPEEAEAAKLPVGTIVIINGRRARIK